MDNHESTRSHNALRIGTVNFLNTLPLIDGLDHLKDVTLIPDVPARLIDHLLNERVDVALCSIIDYQRSDEPLCIVPAGILGSDGPTMTVRLFSQVPIGQIDQVHCDTDSHTSVVLLRVLLHEQYGIDPEVVDYDFHQPDRNGRAKGTWPTSMLLIGDKVVTDSMPAIRYPYQLDLGAAWKEMTGLPFVFATWLAKPGNEKSAVCGTVLDRVRRHNTMRIDRILHDRINEFGWPIDLAREYLSDMITYDWTDKAAEGIKQFFELSHSLGLVEQCRPIISSTGL